MSETVPSTSNLDVHIAEEADKFFSEDEDEEDQLDELGVFKLPNQLSPAEYKSFTTQELYRMAHCGEIDINPIWQRDVVWSEGRMSALIDSILTGHHVPEIVLAKTYDELGEAFYVCVDGKQRLSSIQRFLDGMIPYRNPNTNQRWYYTVPDRGKKNALEIPDEHKEIFNKKELRCAMYNDLKPGQDRGIFERVQYGVPLNQAEKLRAIDSPMSSWIAQLTLTHVSVDGGLASQLNWETKRGRDFLCMAQLVYCCVLEVDDPAPSEKKLEIWLKTCPLDKALAKNIDSTLRAILTIATTKRLNAVFKEGAKVAPVEFVYIGVLLYLLSDRPIEARAEAAASLRKVVRKKHKDAVRMNSAVAKTMWQFIRSQCEREYDTPPPTQRRRRDDDDEDGDESMGTPASPKKQRR